MTKTEIICDMCSNHFIIVTVDDEPEPAYCPFCKASFGFDEVDYEEDDNL